MSGICSRCSPSSCATTATIVPTAHLSWGRRCRVRQCRAVSSSVDRAEKLARQCDVRYGSEPITALVAELIGRLEAQAGAHAVKRIEAEVNGINVEETRTS